MWKVDDDAISAQRFTDQHESPTAMEEPPCSSCELVSILLQSSSTEVQDYLQVKNPQKNSLQIDEILVNDQKCCEKF